MKILHCSDAHADKSLLGVDRFGEVERAFEETVRAAVDEKVGLWAFTGDLCDPDDGPTVLRCVDLAMRVAESLSQHGIPNWWVAGNHDAVLDGSGRTTLAPLRYLASFAEGCCTQVFESPAVRLGLATTTVVLPYSPHYDPAEAVRVFKAGSRGARAHGVLVLTHLSIDGAELGDESTEMARGREYFYPWQEVDPSWLALGGHYHRRQVVRGPGGRAVHVAGSMARHAFGEEGNVPAYSIHEV